MYFIRLYMFFFSTKILVILLAPANDSWTSICLLLHFYSLVFTLVYALHGVFASFVKLGWC